MQVPMKGCSTYLGQLTGASSASVGPFPPLPSPPLPLSGWTFCTSVPKKTLLIQSTWFALIFNHKCDYRCTFEAYSNFNVALKSEAVRPWWPQVDGIPSWSIFMRPVVGDVEAEQLVVASIQLGRRKHVTTFEQHISVQISTNTLYLRQSSSTIL